MVNSLANHGFLPHDGLNISLADLIVAFNESLNLAPAATTLVGQKALLASTTGSNATFNLDDINTHGSKYFVQTIGYPKTDGLKNSHRTRWISLPE